MATLPTQVQPGDIISSELMNAILAELARLGGSVAPSGTQVVPNLFGTFLGDARSTILQPTRQLQMGFIYDVSGGAIDPLAAANFSLIVLNQSPIADARVAPQTPVNLVVSRAATASTPTPAAPTIDHTETATGTTSASFPVGGTMVIVGTDFSATVALNTVRFDGTSAAVTVDPADPTRRLLVVVPSDIPGAPVNPGDPPKADVVVSVQVALGTPATTSITVTAPVAGQPTITSVTPATQYEGSDITIVGTNLVATAEVWIRDIQASIVSRTPSTQIVATVPAFGDILPGPPVTASLVVHVPDVGDASFTGTFRIRGSA